MRSGIRVGLPFAQIKIPAGASLKEMNAFKGTLEQAIRSTISSSSHLNRPNNLSIRGLSDFSTRVVGGLGVLFTRFLYPNFV